MQALHSHSSAFEGASEYNLIGCLAIRVVALNP